MWEPKGDVDFVRELIQSLVVTTEVQDAIEVKKLEELGDYLVITVGDE